jgi:hypothetical protein
MTGGRFDTTMAVAATPESIGAALTQVISLIATAERLSADYQLVNLNSLDRRVAAVCEAIAALPQEEARQFRPGMTALMAGLDRLEVVTREAYRALSSPTLAEEATSLSELADSTRASAAYARALSVAPPPMSEPSRPGDERRRVDRRFRDRRRGQERRQEERRDDAAGEAGG